MYPYELITFGYVPVKFFVFVFCLFVCLFFNFIYLFFYFYNTTPNPRRRKELSNSLTLFFYFIYLFFLNCIMFIQMLKCCQLSSIIGKGPKTNPTQQRPAFTRKSNRKRQTTNSTGFKKMKTQMNVALCVESTTRLLRLTIV